MADENLTPEEREDAAREEAGRELLELIRADRERQARMREWLRQAVEAGYEQGAADEEAEGRREDR